MRPGRIRPGMLRLRAPQGRVLAGFNEAGADPPRNEHDTRAEESHLPTRFNEAGADPPRNACHAIVFTVSVFLLQ